MPAEIAISPGAVSDAALLARLHAACFDGAWDETAMAALIAGPGTLCLVGFAGDADPLPAGFLLARRAADEAELLTVGVVPACRRLGLARALMDRAIATLRESGAVRLFLEVDEANEAALALYRGLGASPVGQRPGYYEGGADAAIFSLALSEPRSDDGRAR
jgi:[ribosomal protein S18]-alanine N-acetyltransferase